MDTAMSIIKTCLQKINKFLLGLFSLSMFLCSCTNRENSQCDSENNSFVSVVIEDTIFVCSTSQIKNQIWMGENLSVKTFCNGDSISGAGSYDEWKLLSKEKKPAYFEVGIDRKSYQQLIEGYSKNYYGRYNGFLPAPDTAYYVLYNKYAIVDKRKLCPNGWRMPSKDDWNILFRNVKCDKYLIDSIGVANTYGNKYGFSLRPTPYGFARDMYDFNFDFAVFWSDLTEKILLCTMVYDDPDIEVFQSWYPSNKYDGCCVRCIKE